MQFLLQPCWLYSKQHPCVATLTDSFSSLSFVYLDIMQDFAFEVLISALRKNTFLRIFRTCHVPCLQVWSGHTVRSISLAPSRSTPGNSPVSPLDCGHFLVCRKLCRSRPLTLSLAVLTSCWEYGSPSIIPFSLSQIPFILKKMSCISSVILIMSDSAGIAWKLSLAQSRHDHDDM